MIFAYGKCTDPTHFCDVVHSCGTQVECWVFTSSLSNRELRIVAGKVLLQPKVISSQNNVQKMRCSHLALLIWNFSSSFSPSKFGQIKMGHFPGLLDDLIQPVGMHLHRVSEDPSQLRADSSVSTQQARRDSAYRYHLSSAAQLSAQSN